MAEIILEFCANPECCEPITIENWPDGGTVQGYPFCPACFRVEEEREAYRKALIEERYA